MKTVVPLAKAADESIFGAKAVGLGEASRNGLPIPPGYALSGEFAKPQLLDVATSVYKQLNP